LTWTVYFLNILHYVVQKFEESAQPASTTLIFQVQIVGVRVTDSRSIQGPIRKSIQTLVGVRVADSRVDSKVDSKSIMDGRIGSESGLTLTDPDSQRQFMFNSALDSTNKIK
jgi:hypothetical protein